jgi:hypothetical protein
MRMRNERGMDAMDIVPYEREKRERERDTSIWLLLHSLMAVIEKIQKAFFSSAI